MKGPDSVVAPHRRRSVWLVLFTVALGVRVVAAVWWQAQLPPQIEFLFPDSRSYWHLGQRIAFGEPYEYGPDDARIFRTPGYPAMLAPLYFTFGRDMTPLPARLLGAVLGTVSVALVGWLAWLLFDGRTALGAAAISAFYPGAVATSLLILTEVAFCPLMLASLGLWILALRTLQWRTMLLLSAAAGIAGALAVLVRPSWLLFPPLVAVGMLAFSPYRRRHAAMAAALLAATMLTLSPWWVRNYQITGRFVPTTLQVGASLYDGLNPAADGSSQMQFVERFRRQQHQADAEAAGPPPGTFEWRLDRRMRDAALSWAAENPIHSLQLAAVKLARTWNIWPNYDELRSPWIRLMVAGSYLPVIVFAVIGACRWIGRGWPYALLLMPAVYFSLLHMVFVGSIRYRQPAMLTLIALAAAAVLSGKSRTDRPVVSQPT